MPRAGFCSVPPSPPSRVACRASSSCPRQEIRLDDTAWMEGCARNCMVRHHCLQNLAMGTIHGTAVPREQQRWLDRLPRGICYPASRSDTAAHCTSPSCLSTGRCPLWKRPSILRAHTCQTELVLTCTAPAARDRNSQRRPSTACFGSRSPVPARDTCTASDDSECVEVYGLMMGSAESSTVEPSSRGSCRVCRPFAC